MTSRHRGLSLIELLVSLAISAGLLAVVASFYAATSASSGEVLKSSKLNQELLALMTVMTSEIRRAGYRGGDPSGLLDPDGNLAPTLNGFNGEDTTLALAVSKGQDPYLPTKDVLTTPASCVLFTYDRDDDGAPDPNEILGFRLEGTSVEMRTRGDVGNVQRCTDDDDWEALTDGELLSITRLDFTYEGSACVNLSEPDGEDNDGENGVDDPAEVDCYETDPETGDRTVETRQVTITLEGELQDDPTTRGRATQSVLVRNDLVRVRS